MSSAQCVFLDPKTLTVGEVATMKCHGIPAGVKPEALRFALAGEEKNYKLKLLNVVSVNGTEAEFQVTSYKTGEFRDLKFILTDGKENYKELEPLSFTVQTVIKEQNQEPFPAFGPWKLTWPLWYWLVLAAALIGAASFAWWWGRRIKKEFELRREVEEYRKKHSPFDEFQRELRQLRKRSVNEVHSDFVDELNNQFRLFMTREFVVRFQEGSDRRILRRLRKKDEKSFSIVEKDIRTLLNEIARAKKSAAGSAVSPKDFEQMVLLANRISDRVSGLKEAQS